MRDNNDGTHQDLYYKYFDLKKQVTKTNLVSEMHQRLERAEQLCSELNRSNANLKFKC